MNVNGPRICLKFEFSRTKGNVAKVERVRAGQRERGRAPSI